MNAIFTYLFKHQHYKNVIATYNEVMTKYSDAYKIWEEHEGKQYTDTFASKETIVANIQEIQSLHSWIKTATRIRNTQERALLWFFTERGSLIIPELHYNEYKIIAESESYIKSLQSYLNTYYQLIRNNKEAVDRFLQSSSESHSYAEIKRIAESKVTIERYTTILVNAQNCCSKYYFAWKVFAKGRSFNDIPISELESIKEDDFSLKDSFVYEYEKEPTLVKLILGDKFLPIDSFDEAAIDQATDVITALACREMELVESFSSNLQLDDQKELKRTILDSLEYGNACNFAESFTVSKFYNLRTDFDKIGVSFDQAVYTVKRNEAAIKSYNQIHNGKSCVFIEDYLRCVTEGSPLSAYISSYIEEQNKRNEAKRIKSNYPKGYTDIFGTLDLDNCSIQYIEGVINAKERIQEKDRELERIERARIEAERKRQEEIRKRQEIQDLKSCVSSWPQPRWHTIKYNSLYNYYPVSCPFEATEDEWDVRNLIWNFKAKPHRVEPVSVTINKHQVSMRTVIPQFKNVLNDTFGNRLSSLMLVCVPASNRVITERRFKDFSDELCSQTGMQDGYSAYTITRDGISKNDPSNNTGRSIPCELEFNRSMLNGKYILLFDDVVTTGSTLEKFKNQLESAGAIVIGAITIGKTKHER